MRWFRAELHLHTVLSPCADVEMIPPFIVQQALESGLNIIAVTDHNASANIPAVQKAAEGTGLTVLPGMEVQTREEVHVLCLFDTLEQIETWQEEVNGRLPELENDTDYFGEQFVVDETGDFLRREKRLLITSTSFTFDDVITRVEALGGLAIPAHVDRKANGLLGVLGFVPHDVKIEGLEISRRVPAERAVELFPQIKGYPLLQGGDAHRLEEILGANDFWMDRPCIHEMRLALKGRDGRRVEIRKATTLPTRRDI